MGNLSKIGNGKAIVSLNNFSKDFLVQECRTFNTFAYESNLISSCLEKLRINSDIFTDREICAFYILALKQVNGKNLLLLELVGKLATALLETEFDLDNLDTELTSIQNGLC